MFNLRKNKKSKYRVDIVHKANVRESIDIKVYAMNVKSWDLLLKGKKKIK